MCHPHIVQVHDFDEAAGLVFLVMEHIEGGTLKQKLTQLQAEGTGLPFGETARIVGEVAEALAHAHAQGIRHRDVKPSNVMLTRGGRAVAFGASIARLMTTSAMPTAMRIHHAATYACG
ncbi:MAG: protein kinase [Chloroflexi bacterium]|nr:protein kinase [Chloroflexota bacterium]